MTDKRRQFLELLGQGLCARSACKKLGISRSSGNRWKNRWSERQKGGTVRFVPPLYPLAARTISPRFLSETERMQTADLANRGIGPTAIGWALSRAQSTISRELRRNLQESGQHRPFHAHAAAATRRRRRRSLKLSKDATRCVFVLAKLRGDGIRSRSLGCSDSPIRTIRAPG
ncbi:helix-turn-helix domain-containing protein [Microbacterium sp. cf046]|uniref:helix-turn-helix domain-containing protein n=1 Tax=Microbacterium sp. cf046 TaxID=1761803 RepID=UPI000B81CC5B|nr:helix-turn-helix domain-containing protein [Microbacterium sp. cf046]